MFVKEQVEVLLFLSSQTAHRLVLILPSCCLHLVSTPFNMLLFFFLFFLKSLTLVQYPTLLLMPHLLLLLLFYARSDCLGFALPRCREFRPLTWQPSFTGIWCEIDLILNPAATVLLGGREGCRLISRSFWGVTLACLKRGGHIKL